MRSFANVRVLIFVICLVIGLAGCKEFLTFDLELNNAVMEELLAKMLPHEKDFVETVLLGDEDVAGSLSWIDSQLKQNPEAIVKGEPLRRGFEIIFFHPRVGFGDAETETLFSTMEEVFIGDGEKPALEDGAFHRVVKMEEKSKDLSVKSIATMESGESQGTNVIIKLISEYDYKDNAWVLKRSVLEKFVGGPIQE